MTQNWQAIWNRRISDCGTIHDLGALISLDGFDTGAGKVGEEDSWRTYTGHIAKKVGIADNTSVFEIGCGGGAFLYALQEQVRITVAGIDYAAGLIAVAKKVMPNGEFEVLEANLIAPHPQYDYVIANSVFQYFSLEYASAVLHRIIDKAKIAVALMDIPDVATKEESERIRRDILTPEEYERKYCGLEHTYYDRDWFVKRAEACGRTCEIFEGCIPNYLQNRFRFGCVIRK